MQRLQSKVCVKSVTTYQDIVWFYQKDIHNPMKPNVKCFSKIVNRWIQSTIFARSFILDVSLSSEYVFDYPENFSIIISWDFHFESFRNFFNLNSIFNKYSEQKCFHYVQKCYVWNLPELHHVEQERLFLSCTGFFINNLEHIQIWLGCLY